MGRITSDCRLTPSITQPSNPFAQTYTSSPANPARMFVQYPVDQQSPYRLIDSVPPTPQADMPQQQNRQPFAISAQSYPQAAPEPICDKIGSYVAKKRKTGLNDSVPSLIRLLPEHSRPELDPSNVFPSSLPQLEGFRAVIEPASTTNISVAGAPSVLINAIQWMVHSQ
ncbi:hypothetical protein M422DRAFT_272807 [Sphaerobolus stellatus SS14]|uniref:Uncharacterized protein n=1 Tax=Sphaerobolus stellatus (strain SS14) TaxID=990650 RepID=A0A0C9TWG1_SPHS4|nr:hypothetical protein M422DRAFT_272807 [Sphaerobolus stellatus SS14]